MRTERPRTAAPDTALWMARAARDHLVRTYRLSEARAVRLLEAEGGERALTATLRQAVAEARGGPGE